MHEIVIAAITAAIGALSSGLLAGIEARLRGTPARTLRVDRAGIAGPRLKHFALPWIVALVVGALTTIVLLVLGNPSQARIDSGDFADLFATSAQVSVALLLALAIEARGRIDLLDTRTEALEASVCIALGVLAALVGLMPGLPTWAYGVALTVIPGAVVGGLLAVVLIAFTKTPAKPPAGALPPTPGA